MQVTDTNNLKKRYLQYKDLSRSMIFRIFILMGLLATYIFPTNMLNTFIDNKIETYQQSSEDITTYWNSETLIGPVLSIPYVERISRIETQTDSNGVRSSISRDIFNNKTLMLLPENLHIDAVLSNELVTEDGFTANTYRGEIILSGNFNLDSLPEPSAFNSIDWDQAVVALGFNDNRGVEISSPFRWEGSSVNYQPGTMLPELINNGLHVNIEEVVNDNPTPEFTIRLTLKGNNRFQFAPVGQITTAKIISNSQNIDVFGDIPEETKINSDEGFEAYWKINSLKRNYPQEWLIEENEEPLIPKLSSVLAGVELSENNKATTSFEKMKTIILYIIPLLSILFLSLYVLEFINNDHPKPTFIHYIIISLPIMLMPIITLTICNSLSFVESYIIATIAILCIIILYLMISLKNITHASFIFIILVSSYSFLYFVIDMHEHEFLAATIAGMVIISLLMLASINFGEDL